MNKYLLVNHADNDSAILIGSADNDTEVMEYAQHLASTRCIDIDIYKANYSVSDDFVLIAEVWFEDIE